MPEPTAGANPPDATTSSRRTAPLRPLTSSPFARRRRARAFTLLELLTVIAIVAVLSGIVIGVGRRASETGKIARAKAELAALSVALESYKRQFGDYPRTDDNAILVQSLIGKLGPTGSTLATASRTHLEAAKFTLALESAPTTPLDPFATSTATLLDPWGQSYRYVYRVPASDWTNHSFVLYSIGPDGADAPTLLTGGFIDVAATANADNVYANRN